MTPGQINAQRPEPVYRCRPCKTSENLSWYRGTSCPVCDRPECHKELDAEWAAATNAYQEEGFL